MVILRFCVSLLSILPTFFGHHFPLFASKLVVPVIYINDLPAYLKEGSQFLRYLRETKRPFAVLINYGAAQLSEMEGQAAWKLLTGELRDQFLGWIWSIGARI